jgi:membrane protease YdiL (CAAX protease family)
LTNLPQPPLPPDPYGAVPWARPAGVSPRFGQILPPRPAVLSGISTGQAWGGLGLTVVMLVLTLVLLPFGLTMVYYFLEGSPRDPDWQPPMAPLILIAKSISAAMAAALLVGLARGWRTSMSEFGVRADGLGAQLLFVAPTLIGVFMAMFAIGIPLLFFLAATGQEEEMTKRVDFIQGLELPNLWVTIISMILVATHEEILFRGLAIPILRRLGLPVWAAIVIISVTFGSLHFEQGWSGMIQITGVSLVLGTAFVLTRSLLTVILAHAAFNVIGTELAKYAIPLQDALSEPATQPAAEALGLLLAFAGG